MRLAVLTTAALACSLALGMPGKRRGFVAKKLLRTRLLGPIERRKVLKNMNAIANLAPRTIAEIINHGHSLDILSISSYCTAGGKTLINSELPMLQGKSTRAVFTAMDYGLHYGCLPTTEPIPGVSFKVEDDSLWLFISDKNADGTERPRLRCRFTQRGVGLMLQRKKRLRALQKPQSSRARPAELAPGLDAQQGE
jgi:hypothetical protein